MNYRDIPAGNGACWIRQGLVSRLSRSVLRDCAADALDSFCPAPAAEFARVSCCLRRDSEHARRATHADRPAGRGRQPGRASPRARRAGGHVLQTGVLSGPAGTRRRSAATACGAIPGAMSRGRARRAAVCGELARIKAAPVRRAGPRRWRPLSGEGYRGGCAT
jgi:hypothetical protein